MDNVTVTQADRERYIELFGMRESAGIIRKGAFDNAKGMVLLARHRIAAIEEAAKVADNLETKWNLTEAGHGPALRFAAAEIRALAKQENDDGRS